MISDPLFYLIAVPAVLLTGISKGGFGGALAGIAVPLMALVIAPRQAAAIMLPILCLTDVVGLRAYFGKWDSANLRALLPGALIGVVLGALTFGVFDESAIRLLVGSISVLFVLSKVLFSPTVQKAALPSMFRGTCYSAVSGFTSFVAHAGGPPIMMYLLPQRLDKTTYVATINIFFLLTNAVKLLPYAWLGQFSGANLLASLSLAPLVPLGVSCGLWLQKKVSHVWFYRIAQAGVLLAGLQLIYQGLTG